jgi:hypothetical protein
MSKNTSGQIFPIIINQTNLLPSNSQNVYSYVFPGSASFDNKCKIAIANVQMYYSWYNISAAYNNNTFSIIIPTAATTQTLNLTIPDGSYSVADLQAFIEYSLIQNNIGYLVDSNGNYVYYISISENAVRYSIQVDCFSCPTALPAGYTNPGGWVLPATAYTPQLVVPNTGFVDLLGINAGTYPSPHQTTNYSKLSDNTPQLSPVSSVIVGTNVVSNRLSNPQNVIYSFSPGGTNYGDLIQSNAYEYSWISINPGTYPSLDIIFYDQNFSALNIVDTNIVVFLLIKFEE